jgi:hypothetical protein
MLILMIMIPLSNSVWCDVCLLGIMNFGGFFLF